MRAGIDPLEVPVYDHLFYDVMPEPAAVPAAPVVILEGVNVLHFADHLDLAVYVDAAEPDMRRWYVAPGARPARRGRRRARRLPPPLPRPGRRRRVAAMALGVWDAINLPNLRESIEPTRDHADVVVVKGPDHGIAELRLRG